MTQHTKTPWVYNISANAPDYFDLKTVDGSTIGQIDRLLDIGLEGEGETNAAHIVKCVNSHDALVSALKQVALWDNGELPGDVIEQVKSAIKQAETGE